MEENKIDHTSLLPQKLTEEVLVVKRSLLFADNAPQGFCNEDIQKYTDIILKHQEYHPRGLMENDPRYKQIIPYLIFQFQHRFFLMERQAKASEQRLKSKLSLGIGGHIRKEDMQTSSIFDWAQREFYEEVYYNGSLHITPLGVVNDDSNEVGKVHIGFVFLLKGDSDNISVKSELQSGHLATKEECLALKKNMETWSQLIINTL